MTTSNTIQSRFGDLERTGEAAYYSDIFTTKRKILVAGGTLLGITLLILGILAVLHTGMLKSVSPAGAWLLVGGGSILLILAIGFLLYTKRQEAEVEKELREVYTTPIQNPEFDNDIKKMESHLSELEGKYLYLNGDSTGEGWVDLGERAGIWIFNGNRLGCMELYSNQEALAMRIASKKWLKPYTWKELRALPIKNKDS